MEYINQNNNFIPWVEGIIILKAGFLKQQLHCLGGRDYQIGSWLPQIGIPIHRIVGSETKRFVPLEFKGTINIFWNLLCIIPRHLRMYTAFFDIEE